MKQIKVKHSEAREETFIMVTGILFSRLTCKFKLNEENLEQDKIVSRDSFQPKQFYDSELFRNSVDLFLFWLWSKYTGTKVTQLLPAF